MNLFYWDEWLVSLIKWARNSNFKQFSSMNGGVMFIPAAESNASSLPGFLEWFTFECPDFFTFLLKRGKPKRRTKP